MSNRMLKDPNYSFNDLVKIEKETGFKLEALKESTLSQKLKTI